ncbi:MAG TPA: glycosyltransferase [Longimicrobiales bacterium]|nr:glycosyltransferase [Longimicrobiales bacterium]
MTESILLPAVPWLAMLVVVPVFLRRRVRITSWPPPQGEDAPLVSVVIPARNEAVNISACVASLLNTQYPNIELIVVDDGSTDGTGDIVRILADHADGRLRLVQGAPLPPGWLGKPWACWQGYRLARGELILFTDADTRHDDALLGHAVGALQQNRADMVTVLPRQLMLSFWERLVLPHVFSIIFMRYHDLKRVNRTRNAKDVIANGQFILIRREAYDELGGHEALRGVVVEDQQLAQRLVTAGRPIFVAHAHDIMDTRMYRSLGGIVEGWSKNLALGSRAAAPGWIAPAVPWLIALYILVAWVLPPAVMVAGAFTGLVSGGAFGWSVITTGLSLLFWLTLLLWMRVPPVYAVLYPVGALVTASLFVRSALRGSRVAWKGREYDVVTDT